MFEKSIRNILAVAIVAMVLAGVFGFAAEGKKGKEVEIKIKGTDGADAVTINEATSTIGCTTCTVTGPVTPGAPGTWTVDAGGAASNRYKIDTGNGSDTITINDAAGNDTYDIKAGAGDDTVTVTDGAGDDKYKARGGAGTDTADYTDFAGDEDKIDFDT